ncbi:MAG: UbiH/UbiF/VisC/COQ6 family ubiquinone biosynthesis hydroxylase, partial [Gammaproteobacteria bacterium]
MSAVTSVDVAIVGGGMVGASLALALGREGFSVAVLEASSFEEPAADSPPALRVSAINAASSRFFTRIGAWQGMVNRRVTPYRGMDVWDSGSSGQVRFDAAELHRDELGHIIENWVVHHALLGAVKQQPSVQWLAPVVLEGLERDEQQARLTLEDGRSIQCKLAVAADGARSRLRELAGIEVKRREYDQRAVVTVVETQQPHQSTAWQRFLPEGPLAFLPLWNGQSSIVWSTSPHRAEQLLACDEAEFRHHLGAALDHRLGEIVSCSERAAFPLARQDAEQYVAERVALVGDAAHVVHPLAGQGANLGFMDAASLFEVLADSRTRGRDIGREPVLRAYQRWR